jgi:hypothetical protein
MFAYFVTDIYTLQCVPFKNKANMISTHKYPHTQNDETNKNTEFCNPYPVVAADALFEIGTAVIAAVSSLDEHLPETNTPASRSFVAR